MWTIYWQCELTIVMVVGSMTLIGVSSVKNIAYAYACMSDDTVSILW